MTTLTLGDFEFARFEIPETIPFGAKQKVVVHQLIGGKRQVDAMGSSPRNPAWSGYFVGENALSRARYLKGLCEAGKPLKLTWSELSYMVLIESVDCDFRLAWRIPYQISLEVITDDTALITEVPAPSIQQQVNDDLSATSALAALIGDSSLASAIGAIESTMAGIRNFTTAALSEVRSVLQPIQTARAVVSTLLAEASTTLAGLGNLASLGGLVPNPVSQFVSGMASSTAAATNSGILGQIDGRLGRMELNITALTSGVKTVTTGSTTLLNVAASQYGDARDWTLLAQANGVTDPEVSSITTLVVPAASTSGTGGVLNA